MKKLLAVLMTSCMVAGIVSPVGTGLRTEIEANYKAAMYNVLGTDGSAHPDSEAASDANEDRDADTFDRAISDLYDQSQSVTDEEILACAEMMPSDFGPVSDSLGNDASEVIDRLKYYEVVKSDFMSGVKNVKDPYEPHIMEEWERQCDYTSYVMPATDSIRVLIPRIKVTNVDVSGQKAVMDVYEWMTVGYAPEESEKINATAYGYNFKLIMTREAGEWKVSSVTDTDQNFTWMQEEAEAAAEDAKAFGSGLGADAGMDLQRVTSEDGALEMLAASTIPYSYDRSKALAYGDKYCINYNPAYNSYKGRGGDCANFVSQCLYAGGFPQDSVWYKHSVAWINVMKQIAHFKAYGTFLNANNGNLLKGNPIYFDWNGDGTYDHATICAGRNSSGVAILDSHTKDLYHATWTNWSFRKAATIQLRNSGTAATTSLSGSWKKDSKGKYYVNADGSRLKSSFQSIGGKTYYFNSKGYMVTGWVTVNSKKYFMNRSTGSMCTGWVTDGGKKYYLQSNGVAATEWEKIGNNWYYFIPETCAAATGFYKVKGKLHYFCKNGVEQFGWITTASGKKYWLDEYGVARSGWHTIGGKKYYFNSNYVMVTGNVKIDGVVYKFDSNGVFQGKATGAAASTATTPEKAETPKPAPPKKGWVKEGCELYYYVNGVRKTGFMKVNAKRTYYFDKYGVMVTGWKSIKGKSYYFKQNGVMAKGWKTIKGNRYYFNKNGVMKKNTWFKYKNNWYYLQKRGKMKKGWLRLKGRYFFLDRKSGKMKTGWLKDTDGNTYYLNNEGVMVTGKQTIGGRTYRFNSSGALIR